MRFARFVVLAVLPLLLYSCGEDKPRVLVFSKTAGYRHASIGAGKLALIKMGAEQGFAVDTTEVAEVFTEESLRKYRAVVFLSTTGDVLNQAQQNEFMRFIQAGGGYVGIHAAADTEYDWWWYGKLVGAYFKSHPEIQQVNVLKRPAAHPALDQQVPTPWSRTDELYNYKKISADINVLFELDESSYKGGENGEHHPIVWYHDFDGGRAFYTGFGHTEESYTDPLFLNQVGMGLRYAMGSEKPDFRKSHAVSTPEANRFTKVVLGSYFDEPTEMEILPDGTIIFVERKGDIKRYDNAKDTVETINHLQVWTKSEDGLMGITKDPGFATNHWLYLYYAHPEKSANVLSRFEYKDNKIDLTTEIPMLEVGTQRKECCHTGGSLTFGPDGNLYLSTGDNTNPFESDGYSPADDRPGREPFDAQGSSANPNDLRGKILRIHPVPDGTYTIPEGNLFPKGEPGTRPEIYVMGCRNPYRISIDKRTGYLYWGEVGPDAGNDNPINGPRGYDEVNQAKKAGFFGWPYFVGNNYPYAKMDFATKKALYRHDPLHPVNRSPNNTGKQDLPAVSPPFIWYPYAQSPDFPLVKEGGRNAMAGPVYYSADFAGKPGAYPDYFDGKLIIYDWIRNWIRLVTMDSTGAIMDIEPFMEGTTFNNIIDMAFGPDGKLYTLEYGQTWFAKNPDSRLSRIEFNKDNRAPIAKLTADRTAGALPLTVKLSAEGTSDPDGDALTYALNWQGNNLTSANGEFNITFDKEGIYTPVLTVTDKHGVTSKAEVTLMAGNEPPQVTIKLSGNTQFFLPGGSPAYQVQVNDQEDGSTQDGRIKGDEVMITADYLKQGMDITRIAQGHQRPDLPGKVLMAQSDCKACHQVDKKSAGPGLRDVANRYKGDGGAKARLVQKILKGGAGVWGETAMAAHPQLKEEDVALMVEYILALALDKQPKSLPLEGKVNIGGSTQGAWVITASYEDHGAGTTAAQSDVASVVLRSPVLTAVELTDLKGGPRKLDAPDGSVALENILPGSSATYQQLDLTEVRALEFTIAEMEPMKGGEITVYLDSPQGQKVGVVNFTSAPGTTPMAGVKVKSAKLSLGAVTGVHHVVLVFNRQGAAADEKLFYYSRMTLTR